MAKQNHGQRNLTGWQRVSQRKRALLMAKSQGQDLQAVIAQVQALVAQVQEMIVAYNRLAVRFEGLVAYLMQIGHTHPERTAAGLLLLGRRGDAALEPATLDGLNAAIAVVRQRLMDAEKARDDQESVGQESVDQQPEESQENTRENEVA